MTDSMHAKAMEAILADLEGRPADLEVFEIDPVPYTVEGMMDRARSFVAAPGSDPARKYLEGVCVRGDHAWAASGRSAAFLPLVPGVAEGLHFEGKGWAERGHDYPDLSRVIGQWEMGMRDPTPVSARHLRALAELALASTPAEIAAGYPYPAARLERRDGRLLAGTAVLASASQGRWLRAATVLARREDLTDADPVACDARLLIPSLVGAGPVVALALGVSRLEPLLLLRADGERHVIMPLRNDVRL